MNNRMLVPIDLGHEAVFDLVFSAVAAMAVQYDAEIHLITVVPDDVAIWPYVPRNSVDEAIEEAGTELREIAQLEFRDGTHWQSTALAGPVAPTVVGRAVDIGAGLIVMASHNPRSRDILLGGTADRVLRRAPCSVVVLRAAGGWRWSG
ncbi:universal stress protein [Salinisphaera sp. T31B1]|uniref:universal stress protein n=1 Tax=Salinisphaera sp. T31B1 TaxID=727963 RepID=UPI0033425BC5